MIRDEVLFHAGMLPPAFADYVQMMRIYSGFAGDAIFKRLAVTRPGGDDDDEVVELAL